MINSADTKIFRTYMFSSTLILDDFKVTVMSNIASKCANADWYRRRTEEIVFGGSNGGIHFILPNINTLEEFKSYLVEQYAKGTPVKVVYELATPIIEDIDCSDKITQYNEQTTVYNTDNAEIEVSLTNNKAIAQINQNLQQIEEAIAGLKVGE